MSLEIKNLVINVHIARNSAEMEQNQLNALRSEIIDECREYIEESLEKIKER